VAAVQYGLTEDAYGIAESFLVATPDSTILEPATLRNGPFGLPIPTDLIDYSASKQACARRRTGELPHNTA
jgi:hypothetical protein